MHTEPAARGPGAPKTAALPWLLTLGNRIVARREAARAPAPQPVQALSAVGIADDRFEREAHAVADGAPPRIGRIPGAAAVGLRHVPEEVDAGIASARGRGHPLPRGLAGSLGRRLDADLSGVRLHTDDHAHALSDSLHAHAFTTGSDIFFRRGAYDPHSPAGRKILTHELTHVVQQRGPGAGRSEQGPIQRFIMQVGKDDGYTTAMSKKLTDAHSDEGFLQFNAAWDSKWYFWDFGTYAPTSWHKPKGDEILPSRGPSKKLKNVKDDETLRIVGHGNIKGKLGGYSGEEMGSLILSLGLPKSHVGGVDLHGCLPASNWYDEKTKSLKPSHAVALEDFLRTETVADTVRGYEHCIFPGIDAEVASSAYKLFELGRRIGNTDKTVKLSLTEDDKELINTRMGGDAAKFLTDTTLDGTKVSDNFFFFWSLQRWLTGQGLMQDATLIGTAKARAELAAP